MKNFIFSLLFCLPALASAQLADGSIAPDFTLNDINGYTHNLYNYLNQGKTVFIDFSAAHCPTCWAYHNTHALSNLYNTHGPNGSSSNDILVLFIELDPSNGSNELNGISGNTQGNWVLGTPYPIFNPEGSDRDIITQYDAIYYPMVYGICPDRTIKLLGTQNATALYNYVTNSCKTSAINPTIASNTKIYPNPVANTLQIETNTGVAYTIYDISGKKLLFAPITAQNTSANVSDLPSGMYLLQIEDGKASSFIKFVKE